MNWIKIIDEKPPKDKMVIVAFGYIFDNDELNLEGYQTMKFSEHNLSHIRPSSNYKYCYYCDRSIVFWCRIIEPKNK
jgi:hypothetical protein